MNSRKPSIYTEVTKRIIEQLEEGVLPWRRPYGCVTDRNAFSGKEYRGINLVLLAMSSLLNGFNSPLWLTFKEAQKLGGHVKRGEHGTTIIFWKVLEVEQKDENGDPIIDPETGEPVVVQVPFAKRYTVFNLEQTKGVTLSEKFDINPPDVDPLKGALYSLPVVTWGKKPCYDPEKDLIQIPPLETFKKPDAFWSTFFHELIHWTGAPSRLNRNFSSRFGDLTYAFEELIAELGSVFLCARTGVKTDFTNNVSYVDSWLKVMQKDNKAIFTASRKAQEAVDWLLERARERLRKAA